MIASPPSTSRARLRATATRFFSASMPSATRRSAIAAAASAAFLLLSFHSFRCAFCSAVDRCRAFSRTALTAAFFESLSPVLRWAAIRWAFLALSRSAVRVASVSSSSVMRAPCCAMTSEAGGTFRCTSPSMPRNLRSVTPCFRTVSATCTIDQDRQRGGPLVFLFVPTPSGFDLK